MDPITKWAHKTCGPLHVTPSLSLSLILNLSSLWAVLKKIKKIKIAVDDNSSELISHGSAMQISCQLSTLKLVLP